MRLDTLEKLYGVIGFAESNFQIERETMCAQDSIGAWEIALCRKTKSHCGFFYVTSLGKPVC